MELHHVRRGTGDPLVLVHGLGGSHRSWDPIAGDLAAGRELVLPDLPGFGQSPPLPGTPTVAALTDALEAWLAAQGLQDADLVGTSLGARIALELVRRGHRGRVVALDPGGFWTPQEVAVFGTSLKLSVALVRLLRPLLPLLTGNPVTRTLLLAQFSGRPWKLSRDVVLPELQSLADSDQFNAVLAQLAGGPVQQGAPAGTAPGRLTIGWGRRDFVTLTRQAKRAARSFPDAELHWFDKSGHFPQWDAPRDTVALIEARTGGATPALA